MSANAAKLKTSTLNTTTSRSQRNSRLDQSVNGLSVRRSRSGTRSAQRSANEAAGPRRLVPDPAHPHLAVYDGGKDVTPRSLARAGAGGLAPADLVLPGASLAADKSGDRSGSSSSVLDSSMGMSMGMSQSLAGEGSFAEGAQGGAALGPSGGSAEWFASGRRADDPSADDADESLPLSEAALAKPATLLLSETATHFWLDLEGDVVGKDAQAEHAQALAGNERLLAARKARAASSDNFSERAAQTARCEQKASSSRSRSRSEPSLLGPPPRSRLPSFSPAPPAPPFLR